MDEILKKIDIRIEYWQALAAEADEMGSTATMDVCDARVDEAQRIKEILISQQKELATDNNVVTKSGKDNNAKDADYWEREAKKWCAKLGEIRMFVDKPN